MLCRGWGGGVAGAVTAQGLARQRPCVPSSQKALKRGTETSAELVGTGEAGCRDVSALVGHAPEMVCPGAHE